MAIKRLAIQFIKIKVDKNCLNPRQIFINKNLLRVFYIKSLIELKAVFIIIKHYLPY
jgi:hypothetical protein